MHALRRSAIAVLTLSLVGGTAAGASAAQSDGQMSYTSQPDRLAVFLNSIAFAQDSVSLPGGVDIRVVLPDSVIPDTLVLRENGKRVSSYRIDRRTGQLAIEWQSGADSAQRDVTVDYLLGGVSWRPTYDLWLGADTDETVGLDYFAEIADNALRLDGVETRLVAGRVDLASAIDIVSELSANRKAGAFGEVGIPVSPVSQLDIQHVYDIGGLSAEPGDTVYRQLVGEVLPARRLHVWNAGASDQVTVIYKVTNDSEQPFTEGVVRSYQDGLFIGSDLIELTPVGSEGSVTVGHLQDVRVKREQTQNAIDMGRFRYRTEVQLTISNFTPSTVHMDVVDMLPPQAEELQASIDPRLEAGNLMRWPISVEPGDEMVISYQYLVD